MAQRSYLDFDLLIEPGGDSGYRARVLSSPVGERRPVPVRIPFSDLELENFLLRVGRPRRQVTRGEGTPEAAVVKDFGSRLFDGVFTDEVRAAMTGSLDRVRRLEDTGLRVRLRLADSPELADLPWEYLYNTDTRRFLALGQWTPLVRYLDLPQPMTPLTVHPPLRILMMAAGPTDFPPLAAETEWNKVRAALDDLEEAGRVRVDRVPTGTLADLRSKLRRGDYHVFHFIGHGRYDPEAQDGVLALEGPTGRAQLISGADLGALLSDERSLRLVVLNSCEGARGGRSDPYSGTAQSIAFQGIPAVVAMQFEITDEAAILFAHSLYAAVADGYDLDAAVAEARNAVREEPNPVEWATPVLYLRAPDGRIFDVPPELRTGEIPRLRLRPAPVVPPPPDPSPRPDGGGPSPSPGGTAGPQPQLDPRPAASRLPPVPPPRTAPRHAQPSVEEPPPVTGQPPGREDRQGRRRLMGAVVGAVVLAAAGVGGYLLVRPDDTPGAGGPAQSTSGPAPTSEPPLPQGTPLATTTLVVPRTVDRENTDLYLMDSGGAVVQQLTTGPGDDVGPLISKDRRSVVYQHQIGESQYELRTMGSDGTGDRLLPVEGCPSPDRPAWNPVDTDQLAVACNSDGGTDLRIVTLQGATVREDLDPGVTSLSDLTFSHDGTRLVYWGTTDGSGDGQLYSLPLDGSAGAQQLTEEGGNADTVFSPDGTQIAFRRNTGNGLHIYVMAADGSGERALTSGRSVDQDPAWSPDGTQIAFKSDRPGELDGNQIWLMDTSGGGLRQLGTADGEADNAPAWSNR